ncbi:hypothetical protein BCU26_004595 [Vibrio splendidus]|uniref:DUF2721 domain-containing protein n=1 Tax=Vibrio splendidus TaxID=29497 RepID=A0AB35MS53_VIBSP|nr:hypothetical protein [Vibrio splendidus]MDP2499276.1 hypothetical protein [Vibrio splendidus]
MLEIKQMIVSPSFWFASVVIGFIISVLAGFTKDFTENLWVRFSKNRKLRRIEKLESRARDIDAQVQKVKANPHLLQTYQLDILYQKVRQVMYYLVTYFCMFLGLHNFSKDNTSVAIIFGVLALLSMAIPVKIITSKLCILKIVVANVLDNDKHFLG